MSHSIFSLSQLGWRAHYSQQLTLEDLEQHFPARVASVHRNRLVAFAERGEIDLLPTSPDITVGDWVLVQRTAPRIERILERHSLVARLAAGTEHTRQLIAANLDMLFVVTSCNDDFNVSRLERYLALAHESGVDPAIVLTKRDLAEDAETFRERVSPIAPQVPVFLVNATLHEDATSLFAGLAPDSTVAFVGTSGVGKSTLINTVSGTAYATGSIREHDSKGRHTTTHREMIRMPAGLWLIDTPGMRELKLGAIDSGLRKTFDDVESLAQRCRFRDCRHDDDPGCAVTAAIEAGTLERRRLDNYLKLQREARRATQSEHERRAHERRFGKVAKAVLEQKRRERE